MPRSRSPAKRAAILDTAKRLFAAEGDRVSMATVARELGIPVGSIYTYFPSKEALVTSIIEEGWGEFIAWVEEGLCRCAERNTDPIAFLLDDALPRLFADVDLIMLLLEHAGTAARLDEKLERLGALIMEAHESEAHAAGSAIGRNILPEGEKPPASAMQAIYRTGIVVMLLGGLETLRIAARTGLDVKAADILVFLRHVVGNEDASFRDHKG